MTALKAAEFDAYTARPDPKRPIALIFGPDAGLVRERAEALVAAAVDDINDPFALSRIEGDDLTGDAGRIVDEANTIPLFGGRRAVWVRPGPRHNIVPAVQVLTEAPPRDCVVVIEAGDLKKNAPLRALCEKSKSAVAVACYADGPAEIMQMIDSELRAHDLAIAQDARTVLAALLGSDRLASRGEVRKLALYAAGKTRVELEDVLEVVSDASALALDGVVDAAFAGRTAEVEAQFNKARTGGTASGAIMLAALRHVAHLHRMRLAVDDGLSMRDAMFRVPPPVHFRRQAMVEAALKAWTAPRLARAIEQLGEALFETRRQPLLADALTQRALLSLAVNARRRD